MATDAAPLRFGHAEGVVTVCACEKLGCLVTGGEDGQVRLWRNFANDLPATYDVADRVTTLATHQGRLLVATEGNAVQLRSLDDGQLESTLVRFSLTVTHMVTSAISGHALVASSDFDVKWLNIDDLSYRTLDGHGAPVLSVALDAFDEYACTSCGDGRLRIWQLKDATCVKELPILPKTNEFRLDVPWCRAAWHPQNSKALAVPLDSEVQFYDRFTWTMIRKFEIGDAKKRGNICSFNDDGRLLALSCMDGAIFVWNTESGSLVYRHDHPKGVNVCSLLWNPFQKSQLLFADVDGNIGYLDNIQAMMEVSPKVVGPEDAATASLRLPRIYDMDDDEPSMGFDISKIKDAYMSQSAEPKLSQGPAAPARTLTAEEIASMLNTLRESKVAKPFVSGSTPLTLFEHYMKWNRVAMVKRYVEPGVADSIDVEFHDSIRHQSIHFDNQSTNFALADVSNQAVALASYRTEAIKSQLFLYHTDAWDTAKEWHVDLPDTEDVQCLCLGADWVACVSDQRLLRVYTLSGLLLWLSTIDGPVVTMAGRGDRLFIAFQEESGAIGEHAFRYSTFAFSRTAERMFCFADEGGGRRLPISPEATLQWICISELGTMCTADSKGMVRILVNGRWVPVCSLDAAGKKNRCHLWPVDLIEEEGKVLCVCCKNGKYPALTPIPAMVRIDWQLPACEANHSQVLDAEELFLASVRGSLMSAKGCKGAADENFKYVFKSFAAACKYDKYMLAVDIASLCQSNANLQLLIRYAHKNKLTILLPKLESMLEKRSASSAYPSEPYEELDQFSDRPTEVGYSATFNDYSLSIGDEKQASNGKAFSDTAAATNDTCDLSLDSNASASPSSLSSPSLVLGKPYNPFKRKAAAEESRGSGKADSVFDLNSSPKKSSTGSSGASKRQVVKSVEKKEKTLKVLFGTPTSSQRAEESFGEESQELFPDILKRQEALLRKARKEFEEWYEINKASVVSAYSGDGEDKASLLKFALSQFRSRKP